MKVVAVVPIKFNSVRLPGKNILSFTNGRPLCWYIFDTLLKIDEIDEVFVFCSDRTIKKFIPEKVRFLKRDKKFDANNVKMNDILYDFCNRVSADVYIMAHTTAPFIRNKSIKYGINAIRDCGYDSAFSVKMIQDFLWCDDRPLNYSLDNIPRTQDLKKIYMETSGFYMFEKKVIEEYHQRIGIKPYMVEVDGIESIDIDEYDDFLIADAIYNFMRNRSD